MRLIHPRWPLYIIPRANNQFMIGATSIESEDDGVSVRSALELLSAAYAVHPAFGEARIVEIGAGFGRHFPTTCRASRSITARSRSTDSIATASCWRLRWRNLTLGYVERGVIDNEVMQCA